MITSPSSPKPLEVFAHRHAHTLPCQLIGGGRLLPSLRRYGAAVAPSPHACSSLYGVHAELWRKLYEARTEDLRVLRTLYEISAAAPEAAAIARPGQLKSLRHS